MEYIIYMSVLISIELVSLQVDTNNIFLPSVSMVTWVNKMVSFMCGKSCYNTCYSFLSTC